jgi:outer membrane receptor protein involved in Fe transport
LKTNTTIGQTLRVALLATTVGLGATTWSAPAFAQNDETPKASEETEAKAIVVTGSRIKRADYTSNSPTITVDQEFLQQSSTSAIEQQLNKLPQFVVSQSSTVKNNDGILVAAGGDIQPNATNTPGASTVSLRGVGANRSLVLIDGRRGTPGNATGSVDVSTIPSAALERVEVISGGASATYGADAVAGVTNFILKKNFRGLELDAQAGMSQSGNGFEYQVSGIVGADFPDGRGNVSLAMSLNTRELMLQKDNKFFQDLWANPNTTAGTFFFIPRPGISGLALPAACGGVAQPTCVLTNQFPGANPPVPNNTGTVYTNQDGSLWVGAQSLFVNEFNQRGGVSFFKPWARDDQIGAVWSKTANGTLKAINALTPQTVPTDRYNFFARGNYEINDWIGVFGQAGFSNSSTYTVQEAALTQFGWDVLLPWGSGTYTGTVPGFQVTIPGLGGVIAPCTQNSTASCSSTYQNPAVASSVIRNGDLVAGPIPGFYNPYVDATPNNLADNPTNPAFRTQYGFLNCAGYTTGFGGCTNTEAFQQVVPSGIKTLLNAAGATTFSLAGALPLPRTTLSDVKTYTMVGGLQGSIPGTDWTWEVFVNHGISQTLSRQTGFYSMARERAVFTAPNMGQNFQFTSNQFAGLGGLANGFGATTGACTTGLNFFQGYQGVSQNCLDAISTSVSNKSTTRQTIAEANLQGGLFELPAGQLRFALGASYRAQRYSFSNETDATIGTAFLDSIVGIYPSANMDNVGYDTKELYGELLVPVVRDLPFVKSFDLEIGGRMSDYSTTGTSYTFKILGDWQVNDWLRFRGGFNRAERAPNIAELQLTPQQSFAADPIGDVCSTRSSSTSSANPTANAAAKALDVQAVCLALMARDNGGVYVPVTDGASFYNAAQSATRQPAGTGGGAAFPISVGNQYYREHINPNAAPLKPETADTWTIGAVIRSPFNGGLLTGLNLTIDYFNIKISDPIGNSGGGGVLLHCVDSAFNPLAAGVASGATDQNGLDTPAIRAKAQAAIAASTCPNVFRTPTNASANQFGALDGARIITTYDNQGLIKLSGIDATLSWFHKAGPGSVFASINGNYMFNFSVQPFVGTPMLNYVGTQGTGLKGLNFGSSFQYKIFSTLGYSYAGASLSLQWQFTPATDDSGDVNYHNGLAATKNNIGGLQTYNLFNLNGSYQVNRTVRVRFGIDNLFNVEPKLSGAILNPGAGQLAGGSYSFFQDQQGRRFSLGANVKF